MACCLALPNTVNITINITIHEYVASYGEGAIGLFSGVREPEEAI
jgi:hypothetical protein